jgi:hypothetical protein
VKAQTGCELYLEPGEAVALDAGILVGTVLDRHWNGMDIAITDISATCHMPDVIEAPYRPAMLGELPIDEYEDTMGDAPVRLGGPSCLAGDVIGDYRLPVPPSRARASPSSIRRIIRWSRPPPSTGCRCPRSGSGTATRTPRSDPQVRLRRFPRPLELTRLFKGLTLAGGCFCARPGPVCASPSRGV